MDAGFPSFGLLAQLVRAWRWRMALEPLGERPSRRICANAIFLSYASSLVVPRIGEVTRCGTLKTYGNVPFTKALGTVVTERVVDSCMMMMITAIAFLSQLPTLYRFLQTTGTDIGSILSRFTGTGYLVTFVCLLAAVGIVVLLIRRFAIFHKGKDLLKNLWDGILSLRGVRNLPLYFVESLGIWLCYFLHFYLAFFCFPFTAEIAPMAAFLIFCIGTFAVLVPTPNGAGPWHFAIVRTLTTAYSIPSEVAKSFALITHGLKTALVMILGILAYITFYWEIWTHRKLSK